MTHSALDRLVHRLIDEDRRGRIKYALARVWRATALAHVPFATVTGSLGKTTTALMLGAIMATRGRAAWTQRNQNAHHADLILAMGPLHKAGVAEVAENLTDGWRSLAAGMALFRPRVGVVTMIGTDHVTAFASQEDLARVVEVGVSGLPPGATAVLNADDPLVRAMARLCRGPVVTYGAASDADLRVEAIADTWPDRLSFDLVIGAERQRVVTRLCGGHWAHGCTAAIAAARVLGVPIEASIAVLAGFQPADGRMEPIVRDDGVAFIIDEFKNPLSEIAPAFAYLARAHAARKVIVVGSISDYSGRPEQVYGSVAAQALDVADLVLFVGPRASKARHVRHPRAAEAFRDFVSVEAAAVFLGSWLRPGDLVLVRGVRGQDNLKRLHWLKPAATRVSAGPAQHPELFVLVGLGNHGGRYDDTPHNAGSGFIERFAAEHGAAWTEHDGWSQATMRTFDVDMALVRPRTMMNRCGPAVAAALAALGATPERTIIIQDDAAIPLGTVRVKGGGGDGGHKGVRSILQTLATEAPGRLKIGVGGPRVRPKDVDFFVTSFPAEEWALLDQAHPAIRDRLRLALLDIARRPVAAPAVRAEAS